MPEKRFFSCPLVKILKMYILKVKFIKVFVLMEPTLIKKNIKKIKDMIIDNFVVKSLKTGDIVNGKIIGKGKSSLFIDLGVIGTGIVYGREFYEAKEISKNLNIGDEVSAKIVELENEDGYIELSLKEALSTISWQKLRELQQKENAFKVKISGANKGGLLAEVEGVKAFLPTSQLSAKNYPRIDDQDPVKILKELQKFIGNEMEVNIFDMDPQEGKLILSEKIKENKNIIEKIKKYNVGDVVEGAVTAVVNFGAFIQFPVLSDSGQPAKKEEQLEGLIHISELDWKLIEDPAQIIKVGEKIKAKIIDIKTGKVYLSLKALKEDPWKGMTYKKGDVVKGKVTKFNFFGAFVEIENNIQGLCHISQFGSKEKMAESLEINKNYNFQILSLEPENHKLSLKLVKE